ncbi:MAG: AsmA-like C-terminal region-containing protein, partial [Nitrospirota bacterium]|nr:AsmA-like C-terminal region-containing protein [Nitrospirota bacterium]
YFPQAVSFYVPGLTMPLTGVSGNLNFSTTQVKFEQVRALWRNSEFGVHGSIQFQDEKYYDDIQVQGRLQGEDVFKWLERGNPTTESFVQGPTIFEGILSGPLKQPKVALSLDVERTKITVPGILRKAVGVAGSVKVETQVHGGDTLSVERVVLSLPSLHISGRGLFQVASSDKFTASMVVEPVNVSNLPSGLSILDGALDSGTVEVSLNVEGKREDWRRWKKNGWVALTNGRLDVKGIQAPATDVLLRLKFHNHEAEVKRLEFRLVDSQARIEGVVHNWETTQDVEFSAYGKQFDLDLLIPKGTRSPVRDFLERVAATMQVSGQLKFEQAYYKDLQFPQLSGTLHIHEEVIGIEQIVGKMDQGDLKGRFLVHLPVREAASVKSWVNLSDASLEALERSFLQPDNLKERMLIGTISLDGKIEGDGKNDDGIMSSLRGTFTCMIRDGRIQRGTIVPKMLALMNLPTLLQGKIDLNKDGYPFDTQSATIEVNKGVFTSNDIVMSGPILKMTAAGDYDAVHDELNLVAAVSPFGVYFDLLKKVSLFRMLLEGDEEIQGMALFEVKGSLHEPRVQALPVESFTSGLTGFAKLAFTVLKNTVLLPTKILFPDAPKTPRVSGQTDRRKNAVQPTVEGNK